MTIKAVLFDLDGTLLDTLADLADSMNAVLVQAGMDAHPVDAYRYFVGGGAAKLVARAAPKTNDDSALAERLLHNLLREYSFRWADKTKAYDGVADMLDALAARSLAMAVLSNKPHEFTKKCVSKFLPDWRFDVVQGVCQSTPPKPDPAGALAVAHRLAVSPDQMLYVGDTSTDMKTANAAGMCPVGVLWGFRSADELRQNGAAALIKHPSELLEIATAPDGRS